MAKEEQKYYTSSGEEYNPSDYHVFRDEDGNTIVSTGKNGYIWESITNGVPVSVNDKGEWYVEPYLDVAPTGIVAHMPNWFKNTPEYTEWNEKYTSYIQPGINKDTFTQLNDILKGYGSQGVTRSALKNMATSYGITDQGLIDENFKNFISVRTEAETGNDSAITLYDKEYASIADLARDFKGNDAEGRSRIMTGLNDVLENARNKKGQSLSYDEQKEIQQALSALDALSYVDDNYTKFGDSDEEFKGLLQASVGQKLYAGIEAYDAQLLNSVVAVPGRLLYGLMNLGAYGKFDADLGKTVDYTTDASAGANLEGREAFTAIGTYAGIGSNFLITMAVSMELGGLINGMTAGMAGSAAGAVSAVGTFLQSPVGSLVTDFFLHDVPIDLLNYFTVASGNDWDWGKAWDNPDQEQNLIAVPIVGSFGPKVSAGLKNDLIGDAIVDLSMPVLGQLGKVTFKGIDVMTNGAATRFKEYVAVKNLAVQEKLTNIPVVGTAWKKFINHFMGAENANFIRNARKASIAEGTMDWYRMAQNILTIKNQGGASEVAHLYNQLLKKTGTLDAIQEFQKMAKKYGGIDKVQVNWKETKGGEVINHSRTVPDVLPKQVKQGIMDIERLAELRGQEAKMGGLVNDPARTAEIQKLEARVEKLPQEIKDFADKFSELNKRVSELGVELGVTNEDWLKAMQMDPEFEKYMVRQALVPTGDEKVGSGENPAILNKGRKGYYSENYLDPTIALNMKVAALGRAFAWNQQAKAVVAMENARGRLVAGKSGADAAKRIQEVKAKIVEVESVRTAVDYDGALKNFSSDADFITNSINTINELLNAPGDISIKSVYSSAASPEISSFVHDYESGKIKFGDGAKEEAGLSDFDADFMIQNTYSFVSTSKDGSQEVLIDTSDNAKMAQAKDSGDIYNAGVAPDGTAYRYQVEDGVITHITEIKDPAALADTINRLGGIYRIDAATVKEMGVKNARAINSMILFYRDNMPNLPYGPTFRLSGRRRGAFGWIYKPNAGAAAEYGFKIENGHIACEQYPIYLGRAYYRDGAETSTVQKYQKMENKGENPKSTSALPYTPIHECGHNTMARLAVAELNAEIDAGKVKITEGMSQTEIGRLVGKKYDELHARLAKNAFESLGVDVKNMSDAEFQKLWQKTAYDNISHYAGKKGVYQTESFAEAISEVWGNGDNASKFAVALVEQMRIESQKYAMAANPRETMKANGILFGKDMFNADGSYKFPDSVKTNAQKAQWLAKKRKENPYIGEKGKALTRDDYIKANKWDTYFKKEIECFDSSCKTKTPELLVAKNGDFLEELANNSAKMLVENIRKASIEGFDENLAMIALGQNKIDSSDALDNFLVSRVNDTARRIASKMEGGLTEENLNIARITLYQDSKIKQDMNRLLSALAPDLSTKDITAKVDTLFKDQAEGLAAVDALPIDYKNLNDEHRKLLSELEESNRQARAVGKDLDKKLRGEGYRGDVTQVIHYREGGEDVYVVVQDPVTASILKRPDDYKNNGMTATNMTYAANSIARMYRLGTTGLNPIALVRNVLRDPFQAWVTAGTNPFTINLSPQAFYGSLRQYGLDDETIRKVEQKLQNWASTSSMTQEIRRMGGETPGTVGYRNKAEKFHKDFNNKVVGGRIFDVLEQPMEMWESMFRNQVAQQSFVKAMRRTGGDVDKSLASAMFDASNATTNFSHAIGKFQNVTSTIPYLSSAINGTASFWRLFNNDPIGMMGRLTAGFMVPVAAITAWNLGSEERKKQYLNLPEWYRDGHIVLLDNDGNIFSLPIPDEVSQFSGTIRRLIEYTDEANQYSIPSILAQGALGFVPVDLDGYFNEDGSLNLTRGTGQMLSGLIPQAVSAAYEIAFQEKLYTGQDISDYSTFNKIINALGNVFGTSFVNIVNDIGFLCGASSGDLVGKTTAETLARDLFGMGFNEARDQFMKLVGDPSSVDPETGKETKATGLFAESEKIQKQLEQLDKDIAFAGSEEEKAELEEKKQKLVEDFGKRVANLTNNYMNLYSVTGGLELWKRKKLIQILAMGGSTTSAAEGSYQQATSAQADTEAYALGRQRYTELGLPSGATEEALVQKENGNLTNSIELQTAVDRFYGAPKQAAQDYKNAIEESGLNDIKNEFYDAIEKIYDTAEAQGVDPDYDMIERIQARYLQAVDAVMVPIINQYGISILNNNDFINEVRSELGGMIPSDDWKQSIRNPKKFLSKKDYPLAAVDVKKWLQDRYQSSMRNRGLDSDQVVKDRISNVEGMIDRGERGKAKGEIESIMNGVDKANFYISSTDYQRLLELYNMVK